MSFTWPQHHTQRFIAFAKRTFSHADAHKLEAALRDGTGTEHLLHIGDCCHDTFKKGDDDVVGECLDEIWNSEQLMSKVVENAIEAAHESYTRMIAKGSAEGLKTSENVEKLLMKTSWKESFNKALAKLARQMLQDKCLQAATDGTFCALTAEKYENLANELLSSLMTQQHGHMQSFLQSQANNLGNELEFMEYGGAFKPIQERVSAFQDCHMLWLKSSHLKESHLDATLNMVTRIKQIPYELVQRAQVLLSATSCICIVLLQPLKSKIKVHKTPGAQYTCIYLAHGSDDVKMKINAATSQEIDVVKDGLVILGPSATFEIDFVGSKTFLAIAYLSGATK